jgi:WD40 repeat protein
LASSDCTVRLWAAGSGAALQTLEGHSGPINAVAFSPDGKLLASASYNDNDTVRLWDAGSGAALQTLEGNSNSAKAMAFSPDGKLLASASYDGTVRLWDAGSGAALQTLEVDVALRTLSFSDDGTSLRTDRGLATYYKPSPWRRHLSPESFARCIHEGAVGSQGDGKHSLDSSRVQADVHCCAWKSRCFRDCIWSNVELGAPMGTLL